jgi:probable rRNA maturation factor
VPEAAGEGAISVSGALPAATGGVTEERVAAAVASVLAAEGAEAEEISVVFLSDEEIREMNRRFLGRDYATDVLAFPLQEHGEPVVGDVFVGAEQVERQATEHGVPHPEEVLRVVVHGVLHLLGHDHPEGASRTESEMWRRQEALVARLRGNVAGAG